LLLLAFRCLDLCSLHEDIGVLGQGGTDRVGEAQPLGLDALRRRP
jgi:hypothetical protein